MASSRPATDAFIETGTSGCHGLPRPSPRERRSDARRHRLRLHQGMPREHCITRPARLETTCRSARIRQRVCRTAECVLHGIPQPTPLPAPYLVGFAPQAAALIGLDPGCVASSESFVEAFTGNRLLPGSRPTPVAAVYSGPPVRRLGRSSSATGAPFYWATCRLQMASDWNYN